MSNDVSVLGNIKKFLDGHNNDLKYIVNVETNPSSNLADCVIHEPGFKPRITQIKFEPFMYMKDLSNSEFKLYNGKSDEYIESMKVMYGITIHKLKTGNQKRLLNGYCYKITTTKTRNDILRFLKEGGLDPYEKACDEDGEYIRDVKGDLIFPNRNLYYSPNLTEQFFISTGSRLYKGFEEYKNIHKLVFDIETTGLRYQISRMFAIGIRDNRGFETILEVDKLDDDDSEKELIIKFFKVIDHIKPAIISGYNSEMFDFEFILGRAKMLGLNVGMLKTTLNDKISLKRRPNTSVKFGNSADKYTATNMWGYSVIDINHAAKRTQAINSDIKNTRLKYICKFEEIAKPNRTYIDGEDGDIFNFYRDNNIFMMDENNVYSQVPDEYQEVAKKLYKLQANKSRLSENKYKLLRKSYLKDNKGFIGWFKEVAQPKNQNTFISGKALLRSYLGDDLWETEHVDEAYNQSSFMLAKLVPTTYQRICTMGTASVWNLLLTTWSYENDLAIPIPDGVDSFSGGLARCYKTGYSEDIAKIDFASLYPMLQLTHDIFPMFDITGVIKKMLLYLTTTRNIYKRIASGDKLKEQELGLLKEIDHDMYVKYINDTLTSGDRAMAKIKQLPIKILNNSLFGALGSNISFNWSDNSCAARITCSGRIELRHATSWFTYFGCIPLLAVTDGINFSIPKTTKIRVVEGVITHEDVERPINEMWKYKGATGITALIDFFNEVEMTPPYMAVDNDGESKASLNLSRINYANLVPKKDKITGEVKYKTKLTGNTIKSKTMPEYIEEFIDKGLVMILNGKGKEFVDYYLDYAEDIRYMQIPLKKIASKCKIKTTLKKYQNRGTDKNGKQKAMQAHMELLLQRRNEQVEETFIKFKDQLEFNREREDKLTFKQKEKLVANYMPPEPELDSTVYYVNTGYVKSHGDSKLIKDKVTGEERFCSKLISNSDLNDNPDLKGEYNFAKYLDNFNKRVKTILVGFNPEIRDKILVKINKKGELVKNMFTSEQLILGNYDNDGIDESMYLEEPEVKFWNRYGYDPRKIWDGFKMHDNNKVHFDEYENALHYLNNMMKENGKPLIKSINDNYGVNDLVLLKDNFVYDIGKYNGVYLKIIRNNVEVPKSEYQLKYEEELARIERENRIEAAKISKETEEEAHLKAHLIKRERYFPDFKKQFKISDEMTMDILFNEMPEAVEILDQYIIEVERKQVSIADDYYVGDEGDVY